MSRKRTPKPSPLAALTDDELRIKMRADVLAGAVRDLQEYGYPRVTVDNICTDLIYRGFFSSVLKDARDQIKAPIMSSVVAQLLKDCEGSAKTMNANPIPEDM